MIYIWFRDFPEDVFADGEPFETKAQASEWFNPQYHKWRESGATVTTLSKWPDSNEISGPLYEGSYVKGYKIEEGRKTTWVLITQES